MDKITTQAAIAQSAQTDSIVHADWDQSLIDGLLLACDDNVEANGQTEFWGQTPDGDNWRVHVCDAA